MNGNNMNIKRCDFLKIFGRKTAIADASATMAWLKAQLHMIFLLFMISFVIYEGLKLAWLL